MGLSFLTPLFLAGFLAVAVPLIVHLIRRHRGKHTAFPSLMFLRRLPVQAVRRRRIRDWPLLLARIGALALIVLAFARPVLQLGEPEEGAEDDGLREVVVVLDRSWSMARGDRWERAVAEAGSVLDGLVTPDRVAFVTFDHGGRVHVDPTLDPDRVRAALDTIQPGWAGAQIGTGLQAASGVVQASDRSRREVVLISDFQRRGWESGPRDPLPPGTELIPVDVGDDGLGSMIVSEVTLDHGFLEGRQRVQPSARVIRQGDEAPVEARLAFEMDGQEIASRTVELEAEGATSVSFDPVTLPDDGIRGELRLEPEGAPPEEPFRFFLSPREIVSILLVQEGGDAAGSSPYLRNALGVAGGAPVHIETRGSASLTESELATFDLVILNDLPLPPGAAGEAVRTHVREGGGLFVVAGPNSVPGTWDSDWEAALRTRLGAPVDRDPARGTRLSGVERDHPVFQSFTGSQTAGLGSSRFYRYRGIESLGGEGGEGDDEGAPRVLARFDDGGAALVETELGSGRILVWTSTFDTSWSDFPLHPTFLPVVQEIARYGAGGRESVPYFMVGQPLDARFLLGEGPAASEEAPTDEADPGPSLPDAVVVDPDGTGVDLSTGGDDLLRLDRPGFYEIRIGDEAGEVARRIAVNPDPGEADPERIDPEELVLAATAATDEGVARAGEGLLLDGPDPATILEEGERRQGAWRFLVLGAILLLVGEAVLAGRRRPLVTREQEP